MKFSRDSNYLGTTWAFRSFVKHHTEINNMYWSFVPSWSFTHYIARKNKGTTPELLFHASGPDVHRLDHSIPRFIRNHELLANWVRLSALVSILSYFETYMKRVTTLSLMSDPAVRFGKSRAIDGISWIKHEMKDDLDHLVTSCLKGVWSSRIKAFKGLFSSAPASMVTHTDKLDTLRTLRNKVGHSYGRSLKIELLATSSAPMARLSEQGLKDCLELVYMVAKDVDAQLLAGHIGCFEEALYFHNWRHQLKGAQKLDEGMHLRKALTIALDGRSPGTSYCQDLVAFYHSC